MARADVLARARDAWQRGDPEGALADLDALGDALWDDARALAVSIARVSTAVERTLSDFLGVVVDPNTTPGRARALRVRNDFEALLGEATPVTVANRRTGRSLAGSDEIHAHLCGALPADPQLERLYGREDWILVERGRDGADLWWRDQALRVPSGRHPLCALVPPSAVRFIDRFNGLFAAYDRTRYAWSQRNASARAVLPQCAGACLYALVWTVRVLIPAPLRKQLKRPLEPMLRHFGMGGAPR